MYLIGSYACFRVVLDTWFTHWYNTGPPIAGCDFERPKTILAIYVREAVSVYYIYESAVRVHSFCRISAL